MNRESVGLGKKHTRRSRDARVSSNRFPDLNRSIIILLLLSSLFILPNGQTSVSAFPVSSTTTTTWAWTGLLNSTQTRTMTGYNTSVFVSNQTTTTRTTYTTTGLVTLPVLVRTVVVYPVTSVSYVGPSCQLSAACTRIFVTLIGYVTVTTWVEIMARSKVEGTVTSQSVTYLPTTVTSESRTTYTWTQSQIWGTTTFTGTWTYTTELTGPAPPTLVTWPPLGPTCPNCMLLLPVLMLVLVAAVGFMLGRRGRAQTAVGQQIDASRTFCGKCGAENPASNMFCGSCGNKLEAS